MENQFELQIESTKSGHSTVKVLQEDHEYYLHSKYNPVREAENWAKENYEKGKTIILIGMGLGFQAKALLKIMDVKDRLLLIEPYEKIFVMAQQFDVQELFEDQRVLFCLEQENEKLSVILRYLIVRQYLKESRILIATNYDKIFSSEKLIERIKRSFLDYRFDVNTKLIQSRCWQENYFRNIKCAIKSSPIAIFRNKFTCPVVIVSAGPSLNKELENIKKIYNHALIVSAGTATTVLMKNNIKPHLIITIDAHMDNYDHFKEIDYNEIPLFYAANNHYKITEEHTGPKVIFQWNGLSLNDWFDTVIGFKTGGVTAGPSVANFALDMVCNMTSGPICFVGQDLGYVGGFSHAEGNINRISASNVAGVAGMALLPVESNDGGTLQTDPSFMHMREWFENYLVANGRKKVYNASLQGAKIKGTSVIPFEKFIGDFCQDEIDMYSELKRLMDEWHESHGDTTVQTLEVLKEILVSLDVVIDKTSKAKKLSKKLLNKVQNKDETNLGFVLGDLAIMDKEIISLTNDTGLLYFIIQPLHDIMAFWDEEDSDDYKKRMKIAEKNYFFYSMLDEMAAVVKKILRDELAMN